MAEGAVLVCVGSDTGVEARTADTARLFAKVFPDREIVTEPSADVAYAIVWHPPLGLLARCPNLRAIFSLGAGVDHVLRDPDLPDVPLVRFVDPSLTDRMVEWVVWQVLHHHRRGPAYAALQAAREWRELRSPAAAKLCVGIMGFGELGQAGARALKPFGYRLNAYSRSGRGMEGVTAFEGQALDAFLADTDILVALLPATAATKGILDASVIDRLRPDGPLGGPILINAGRGDSQIGADIDAALRDGRLAGASLDVFETEPLDADSPLWDAPNCVVTPHAAAVTDPRALGAYVRGQVVRLERGARLENVVDRARGY